VAAKANAAFSALWGMGNLLPLFSSVVDLATYVYVDWDLEDMGKE